MTAPASISRTNASFPEYLDFEVLRRKGIEHCQKLGSDLWTDFNLHDPGLTILEALCFALTDLGYRTNFPIEDLLAQDPKEGHGPESDSNFFSAEQILTCNPVTMIDLRKLLIDVDGVRNAWIERADSAEVPIYLNSDESALQYEAPESLADDQQTIEAITISPDGLYVVCVELDDDPEPDACGRESIPVERILDDVWTLLRRHRNLCEDFVDVVVLGDEDIALCVDIEIAPEADPDDTLLGMYLAIEEFLAPTIQFYTLQEMLARGKRIEEIYAGRPLKPLSSLVRQVADGQLVAPISHGFIDTDELLATKRRTEIHASDLYQVIMDVPGVRAIRKLLMVNYINGIPKTKGEKWCLHLTPKHRQRFDLGRSQIQFFKDLLPFRPDKEAVAERYTVEKASRTKAPLSAENLDRPIPKGRYRNLSDYRSIVHEFPLVYGIGEGGLPETAPQARKNQAKQLRAYLLFYDQILANYLAQLANLRDLFSPDGGAGDCSPNGDDAPRGPSGNRTYFTQELDSKADIGIPGIEELLKDYRACSSELGQPPSPEAYRHYLNRLTESPDLYYKRRNQFLDHLLARFSESFTDYVLLMFDVNGRRNDDERIIRDKSDFLRSYADTSRNRGRGYDYTDEVVWDTDNVSGVEARVGRLLGLGNPECEALVDDSANSCRTHVRRTLAYARVEEVDGGWHWCLDLPGKGDEPALSLTSRRRYERHSAACDALESFRDLARDESNYRRLRYDDVREFGFEVLTPGSDKQRPALAAHDRTYPSHDRAEPTTYREQVIGRLTAYFAAFLNDSGEEKLPKRPEIKVLEHGDLFYFQVTAYPTDLPDSRFRSIDGYVTHEAADAAAREIFLPQAAQNSEYRRLSRDGFVHHGFAVVDASNQIVLEPERSWSSSATRDLYLYGLVELAIGSSIRCEPEQESRCHFYQLLDADRERVLLDGATGYPSKSEALDRFKSQFLPRARRSANYRDLDEDGRFGFELLAESQIDVLAAHPQRYATTYERDLRKSALLWYLNRPEVDYRIDGRAGALRVHVLDESNDTLLQSIHLFETKAEATRSFNRIISLARHRESYRPIDRQEGERRFGFCLTDSDGDAVAEHPEYFETAVARDLAIDWLVRLFCPAEDVHRRILERKAGFAVALVSDEESELLVSADRYKSREQARAALRELFALAGDRDNYVLGDDDGAYGFVLHDDSNDVFAVHPSTYAHAAERDIALRALISFVRVPAVECSIEGESGQYNYSVIDPDGGELLRSLRKFPDEPSAHSELDRMIGGGSDRGSYYRIDEVGGFGFGVRLDNEPAAEYPGRFADEAEREAAIDMTVTYFRRAELQHRIDNPNGAFRFELRDHLGAVVLVGLDVFSDKSEAEEAYEEALALARDRERYRRTDDGPVGCRHGFEIFTESGEPVARGPRRFGHSKESDAAMQRVYAIVHDGSTIPDVAWSEIEYRFEICDHDGIAVLESLSTYATTELAHEAARDLIAEECASHYQAIETDDGYTFRYGRPGRWLAKHPRQYNSAEERNDAITATRFTLRSNSAPYTIVRLEDGEYTFQYLDNDSNPVLIGSNVANDSGGAFELLLKSLSLAIARDAYEIEGNDYSFSFQLKHCDGSIIAQHPVRYETEGEASAALENWIDLLQSRVPRIEVHEEPIRFRYQLVDVNGQALIRSTRSWPDPEQAQAAFEAEFVPLAVHKANIDRRYRHVGNEDLCEYSFNVLDMGDGADRCDRSQWTTVAEHPHWHDDSSVREDAIDAVIDLVRSQKQVAELIGVKCGHLFRLLGDGYELQSTAYYTDAGGAAADCTRTLARMHDPNAYIIECDGEDAQRLRVMSADDIPRAQSAPGQIEDLIEMRDRFIELATECTEFPHRFKEYRTEIKCQLVDRAGNLLLESLDGLSAEIWARSCRFDSSELRNSAIEATRRLFAGPKHPIARIEEENGQFVFEFDVHDPDFTLRSRWHYETEDDARDASEFVVRIGAFASNYRRLNVDFDHYEFELMHQTELKDVDRPTASKNREKACDECSEFVQCAQQSENIRLVTDQHHCTSGFELVGPERQILARIPHLYEDVPDRDAHIHSILCHADMEGFHLIEHLLLRPKHAGSTVAYGFAIPEPQSDGALLQSSNVASDRSAVVEALKQLLDRVVAGRVDVQDTQSGSTFSFQFVDKDGKPVAEPPSPFCSNRERDEARDSSIAHLIEAFSDEATRTAEALFALVTDVRAASERKRDTLLPVGRGCCDDSGKPCPVQSDPYSFRVTAVVPYWPSRFRNADFRKFFERTLRLEMPAHVLPRICWVDVCQMRDFEIAYRRWLRAKAHPTADCDYTAAQNELVSILCNLTSIYRTARLFSCDSDGDSETTPLRLDSSILGTSGTNHDSH